MKRCKIVSFKNNITNRVYIRQSNTKYQSNENGQIKTIDIREVFCDNSWKINELQVGNEIYKLGERILVMNDGFVNGIITDNNIAIRDFLFKSDENTFFVISNALISPINVNNISKNIPQRSSVEELERRIISSYTVPIRLKKTLKSSIQRLSTEEFLYRFFTKYNKERRTIFINGNLQTEVNRRRSLGDIFMICKYYFPNITLLEVIKLLYQILPNKFENGFRTSYCNQIQKRVWYYNNNDNNSIMNTPINDEYNNTYNFYLDLLNASQRITN